MVFKIIIDAVPEIFHQLSGTIKFIRKSFFLFMDMIPSRFSGTISKATGFETVCVVKTDNPMIAFIMQG